MNTNIVRLNVAVGLGFIAVGLLFGSFMAAARDIAAIDAWLRSPPMRSNQIMYVHTHFGVIGLANIALGFVLPCADLSSRVRGAASWAAAASGLLVPAGMAAVLLPEPGNRLVYLQAAGFLALLFALSAGFVGIVRGGNKIVVQ